MEQTASGSNRTSYFLQGLKMGSISKYYNVVISHFMTVSSSTIGWIATVLLHCAFIPSIIAVLMGVSDKLPTVDVVLFVWIGLFLFFIRSIIVKDILNTVTGGIGFFVQAIFLALIVFK